LLVLTWGQSNQLGALTFLLLWVLRLSAKFNLFLGAPHRSEALLPPHLAYLGSYFQNRAMNALFPVSMLGGAALVAWMSVVGLHPSAPDLHQTGTLLLMTLAVLGLIEHVFMFLPTPNTALWGWALARAPAKQSHVQPRG
jgi:putative photosynthetic complex assembly protein 2